MGNSKLKTKAEKVPAYNKRITGAMIKREYSIPYSVKTVVNYLKHANYRAKKHTEIRTAEGG